MSLTIQTEKFGGGDDRWMGSRHGVVNAKTGTLKASAFTDKIVKSGFPVKLGTDGLYEPAATDGSAAPAGFVVGDHDVTAGDTPVPVMWHGRILVGFLPVEFTAPAEAGQFTYVQKVEG